MIGQSLAAFLQFSRWLNFIEYKQTCVIHTDEGLGSQGGKSILPRLIASNLNIFDTYLLFQLNVTNNYDRNTAAMEKWRVT